MSEIFKRNTTPNMSKNQILIRFGLCVKSWPIFSDFLLVSRPIFFSNVIRTETRFCLALINFLDISFLCSFCPFYPNKKKARDEGIDVSKPSCHGHVHVLACGRNCTELYEIGRGRATRQD